VDEPLLLANTSPKSSLPLLSFSGVFDLDQASDGVYVFYDRGPVPPASLPSLVHLLHVYLPLIDRMKAEKEEGGQAP
jgi:hypothetical protein